MQWICRLLPHDVAGISKKLRALISAHSNSETPFNKLKQRLWNSMFEMKHFVLLKRFSLANVISI